MMIFKKERQKKISWDHLFTKTPVVGLWRLLALKYVACCSTIPLTFPSLEKKRQNCHLFTSYFSLICKMEMCGEARSCDSDRWGLSLLLPLYGMTMLPCYRNASCIACWKKQDVADAHRFFQPSRPRPAPQPITKDPAACSDRLTKQMPPVAQNMSVNARGHS